MSEEAPFIDSSFWHAFPSKSSWKALGILIMVEYIIASLYGVVIASIVNQRQQLAISELTAEVAELRAAVERCPEGVAE